MFPTKRPRSPRSYRILGHGVELWFALFFKGKRSHCIGDYKVEHVRGR